jgi:hypothetical protein
MLRVITICTEMPLLLNLSAFPSPFKSMVRINRCAFYSLLTSFYAAPDFVRMGDRFLINATINSLDPTFTGVVTINISNVCELLDLETNATIVSLTF